MTLRVTLSQASSPLSPTPSPLCLSSFTWISPSTVSPLFLPAFYLSLTSPSSCCVIIAWRVCRRVWERWRPCGGRVCWGTGWWICPREWASSAGWRSWMCPSTCWRDFQKNWANCRTYKLWSCQITGSERCRRRWVMKTHILMKQKQNVYFIEYEHVSKHKKTTQTLLHLKCKP